MKKIIAAITVILVGAGAAIAGVIAHKNVHNRER